MRDLLFHCYVIFQYFSFLIHHASSENRIEVRANDENNTNISNVSVCSLKKSVTVKRSSLENSSPKDVNKSKCGSFSPAILLFHFPSVFALLYTGQTGTLQCITGS